MLLRDCLPHEKQIIVDVAEATKKSLRDNRQAVISFTLNIAGPVKDSPLIRRAFRWGQEQLEAGLTAAKLPVPERTERLSSTGCEGLYTVNGAAREEVGGGPRNCIVCGAPGKGCASRRVHSVEELQGAARRVMEEHFAAALSPDSARTAGERAYLERGLTGVRGEAAQGFPGVLHTALPVLERALKSGRSINGAGAIALLHLIARGTDTNMVSRGGPELAKKAAEEIARLDQEFIRENLSPGGCADLLAATLFLYFYREQAIEKKNI